MALNTFVKITFHYVRSFACKMLITEGLYFGDDGQMPQFLTWLTWHRWRRPESPTPFVTGSDGGAQTHRAERARRDASDGVVWEIRSLALFVNRQPIQPQWCSEDIDRHQYISIKVQTRALPDNEAKSIKQSQWKQLSFNARPQRMKWWLKENYLSLHDESQAYMSVSWLLGITTLTPLLRQLNYKAEMLHTSLWWLTPFVVRAPYFPHISQLIFVDNTRLDHMCEASAESVHLAGSGTYAWQVLSPYGWGIYAE